jgi:hypothetical protein
MDPVLHRRSVENKDESRLPIGEIGSRPAPVRLDAGNADGPPLVLRLGSGRLGVTIGIVNG